MTQTYSGGATLQELPRKEFETSCFHSLEILERSCEYLDLHIERYGADEEIRLTVKDIEEATAKLSRSLGELMALLACIRGEAEPAKDTVDVWVILHRLLKYKAEIKAELGITLEADRSFGQDAYPCIACADGNWCEQICMHLLSNAMHACDNGGHITIGLQRSADRAKIIIADDGCGLPDGTLESQMKNQCRFMGGAHAGLMLCREYCRLMGWELELSSREGKGTVAAVTLPLGDAGASVVLRSDNDYEEELAEVRIGRFLYETFADIKKAAEHRI